MLKIVLIGTGNVASNLFNALLDSDEVLVQQVFGRNIAALQKFSQQVRTTSKVNEIIDADIYLITVSDDAIEQVSKLVKQKKGMVAHTSGSVSINAIQHHRKAVFYPLQTFTKERQIDFSNVPICIEATSEEDSAMLKNLAGSMSKSVYEISSEQRKKLHLAAVFLNNFNNHLFYIAQQLCEKEKLPFELLKPLIYETADKLQNLSPKEAQTGPARRNDAETMQVHLDMLESPIQKKIYQLLSESIKSTYEKEL